MVRHFSWLGFVAASIAAAQTVVTTRSDHGTNRAVVIQGGPKADGQPQTTVRKGPGYVIIEQRSNGNRAVIMQSD
jgi:hypothetical protein